jgi:hypothetical protein
MNYVWNVTPSNNSTGLTSATPSFIFNSGGTYSVSVIVTNPIGNCSLPSSTANITIPSFGIDVPTIEIGGTYYNVTPSNPTTIAICAGLSTSAVNIFNNSVPENGGNNPAGVSYTFSMNGSSPSTILDVASSNITYGNNPLIITANYQGCPLSIATNVYSGSNPFVSFGTSNSIGLCPGNSLSLSIIPTPPNGQNNPI